MSCGCGCGGHGDCTEVTMPPIGGVMPKAYTGYGMSGIGLGQDGTIDIPPTSYDVTVPPLPTDFSNLPPVAPIPMPPDISPASSGINWNPIVGAWTNITGSILKAEAGANPTYQAIGPGGSVTTYGGYPGQLGLPGSLSAPAIGGISVGMILLGVGVVVLMSMMGGRR